MTSSPLADVAVDDLQPLLDEEADHWLRELYWDFSDVSAAVASGITRGALCGRVRWEEGHPVAYAYYMIDGGRAIVGSVFAARGHRGRGLEEELLDQVIDDALGHPGRQRVECQTLFTTAEGVEQLFGAAGFEGRARHYLVCPLHRPFETAERPERLTAVGRAQVPLVARLIHRSHEGSLDAALNLTYATPAHCQAFVETLVLRAGCGRFASEASFIAERDGEPVAVILASQLSPGNGHICQVSVTPEAQGRGLGSWLMHLSLEALRGRGMQTVTLSVTVGNEKAYELYRRLGFRLHRRFGAHAWVRPPARIEIPA